MYRCEQRKRSVEHLRPVDPTQKIVDLQSVLNSEVMFDVLDCIMRAIKKLTLVPRVSFIFKPFLSTVQKLSIIASK